MKYFALESSLDEKIMGKIPQVKFFQHHCNIGEELSFIDSFRFEKIKIEPILSNAVLYKNAKQTDMINTMGDVGSVFGYLVSDDFKKLLDKFNCYGIQYFQTYIIQNEKKFYNYWQTNLYDFPFQYIDFHRTKFVLKIEINGQSNTEILSFKNCEEFNLYRSQIRYPKYIYIKNISFNEQMNLDFFTLRYTEGGHKGIVSEKLKNEIEKSKITGVEFRPIEMDLNEWQSRDGLRDQIYGRSY